MSSSLFVKPNQEYPVIFTTASYTLTDDTYTTVIGNNGAGMTLILPPTSACYDGYRIIVRAANNTTGASITVNPTPFTGDTINGSTNIAINTSVAYMCYRSVGIWYQIQ